MAADDYQIGGVNISKIVKKEKVNNGLYRWIKLKEKYNIKTITENNNVILFSIEDKQYYYGVPSQKIRRKGDKVWTGKIVAELKKDFVKIPLNTNVIIESKIKSYLPTDNAPGKHKDKTWLEVSQKDPNYVKWMIDTTKNKELKSMLKKLSSIGI
jgi:hypothetical protein